MIAYIQVHKMGGLKTPYQLKERKPQSTAATLLARSEAYIIALSSISSLNHLQLWLKEGIRVDTLKVEEILWFPPLITIRKLPCLQGMASFLRQFVMNYSNLTKGFMLLLKKDTSFLWVEWSWEFFYALNKSLASTRLVIPPDYGRYFLLYVVTS